MASTPGLSNGAGRWVRPRTGSRGRRCHCRRVAALDHEIADDAVKLEAIVEFLLGEVEEVRRRDGALEAKIVASMSPFSVWMTMGISLSADAWAGVLGAGRSELARVARARSENRGCVFIG